MNFHPISRLEAKMKLSGVRGGFEPHPTHGFSSIVEIDTITLGSNLTSSPSGWVLTVTKTPIFNSTSEITRR
jgi:hypothetical protein